MCAVNGRLCSKVRTADVVRWMGCVFVVTMWTMVDGGRWTVHGDHSLPRVPTALNMRTPTKGHSNGSETCCPLALLSGTKGTYELSSSC